MTTETEKSDGNEQAAESPVRRRGWGSRIGRAVAVAVIALSLLAVTGWSVLAIYYSGLAGRSPRTWQAIAYVVLVLGATIFIRPRRFGVLAGFGLFAIVVLWFFSLKPSNDREWALDVANIPSAELVGDQLTIRNIRNFDYRSETDYDPHWETRTYDLTKLRGVDVMAVHWGSPAIAHAMVSFDFEGDQYLAVSIEARRQKTESYSAIEGFFRQFELIYIFSDERDVVRLRTNYRHEDVYLYHTRTPPAQARALLMSYVEQANSLAAKAQFYNALTSNCATNVLENARAGHLPAQMSWKILLSGYAAEQMYDNHRIDTSMPYAQLRTTSHVNEKAIKADKDPAFSRLIRVGLPMPAPVTPAGSANQ